MKSLVEWSAGRIFVLSYLPYLMLFLLGIRQPYNSADRSTLLLLAALWHTGCYAVYLGTMALTLNKELRLTLQDSVRFPFVYILLPILAMCRPIQPSLLPSLPVEHPILLAVVSSLCYFYPAYSTAKYLTTVEQGMTTRFRENVGTCIALSLFPFSVFFIQPRLKQAIYATSTQNDSE